jgi:hypothetical protein
LHPFLLKEHFGGTTGYNLLVNICKYQKFAAPLEFFRELKCAAAPRLKTTALASLSMLFPVNDVSLKLDSHCSSAFTEKEKSPSFNLMEKACICFLKVAQKCTSRTLEEVFVGNILMT